MGMKHIGQIAAALMAAGRGLRTNRSPWSATPPPTSQRVLETTLGTIEADVGRGRLEPPAIICVGRAVLMRQVLDWQALAAGEAAAQPRSAGARQPASLTPKAA